MEMFAMLITPVPDKVYKIGSVLTVRSTSTVQRKTNCYNTSAQYRTMRHTAPPPTWTYTHPGVKPEQAGNTQTP